MLRIISQKNKAFTLLELLIYITVLSILVVVVSNTFISLSRGRWQSEAKTEVNNSVRFSTELLRQDIKNASSVSLPSAGVPGPILTLVRGEDTIIYTVTNGALTRKVGQASAVSLTEASVSVSNPVFTRIENTNTVFNETNLSIKIDMTFAYNSTSPDWASPDHGVTTQVQRGFFNSSTTRRTSGRSCFLRDRTPGRWK